MRRVIICRSPSGCLCFRTCPCFPINYIGLYLCKPFGLYGVLYYLYSYSLLHRRTINERDIPNSPQGLYIYSVLHRRTINERDIPNSPQGLYIYSVWHRRTISERDIPNSPQGLHIYNVWHRRTIIQ